MNITITEIATEELNKKFGEPKGYLKIQNGMEGRACGVGVPTL